jgi:cytochrome c-type biogenesis protein CcmF
VSVEAGHFALVLALVISILQAVIPFWGARLNHASLMLVGVNAAITQFLFLALSFAALATAYMTSDFSVLNVAENSNSTMPTLYKFSGIWGNHEGSMLLWSLILSLFGALIAVMGRTLPARLRADSIAVQGLIGAAFLLFILLTSNPFLRLAPAPVEGQDLNPILQDPGLAIHPPLLYLGYVGFSIVFSFAAAALIGGRIDAAWARFVRPFALIAWCFLTLGIAMGSYWAYYTLGWGGFWFWDPVENASLMPWLAGSAFVHSVAVMEKNGSLKVWTIFLAILAFSFSLLGTFLVRSGVLSSVHAFANDPQRGIAILMILSFFIASALALFAWRAPILKQGGIFAPISREGALVLNNLLLTTSCATVLIGTLYPLVIEQLTNNKITVGAPFFNMTCGVLMLGLFLLTPFGFSLAWKRGDLYGVSQRLFAAIAFSLIGFIVLLALDHGTNLMATLGASIGLLVVLGTLTEILIRISRGGFAITQLVSRAWGLPLSFWGGAIAHLGAGIGLLGLAASGFGVEVVTTLKRGVPVQVGQYEIVLDAILPRSGPNFNETVAHLSVFQDKRKVVTLDPSKRQFSTRQMATSQAGIETLNFGQIYVSISDPETLDSVPAQLYWKPFVTFIWLGGCIMAFGGAVSLADRRLRLRSSDQIMRPVPNAAKA